MKSRAISALVFGLCFGLIFMLISLFTPPMTRYKCGGTTSYEIFGAKIGANFGCTGGSSNETIGFPFASQKKYDAPTINYTGLGIEDPSTGMEYNPPGIVGNLLAYWVLGFLFFFIFARSRYKEKSRKQKK